MVLNTFYVKLDVVRQISGYHIKTVDQASPNPKHTHKYERMHMQLNDPSLHFS